MNKPKKIHPETSMEYGVVRLLPWIPGVKKLI